ncbi:hypothetical protein ACMHYO_16375 [Allopusillimonas ginsengisoli]|uniref:hypothetical protein n=1 Tax=Allopusillimonas ginsengisoli TaxID=453575 RepID=UPI0039C19D16
MDGLTMLGDIVFEHKLWNEELAEQVRAGNLDPHYYWQLEQQLYVAEASRYQKYAQMRAELKCDLTTGAPSKAAPKTYLVVDYQGTGKTLAAPLLRRHLGVKEVIDDLEDFAWPDDLEPGMLVLSNAMPQKIPDYVIVLSLSDALRLVIEKLEASSTSRYGADTRP